MRSRDATIALEAFLSGPNLEFRAVYLFWIKNRSALSEINKVIRIRRSRLHGKWPITNLPLIVWEKPTGTDPFHLPVRWYEDPNRVQIDQVTVEYEGVEVGINIDVDSYYMGDYLIPYSDNYCEGEDYKVWSYPNPNKPDDGFFFTQRKN